MKRKIFSVLLTLVMLLTLSLVTAVPVGANSSLPTVNWLPPISNQGEFQLKDGSTLPIKFTLLGPDGSFVEDTGVHVDVTQVLFRDDFDEGNADNWTDVGTGGSWDVEYDTDFGSLIYSQEDITWTTTSTYDTYWRSYEGADWTNYSVEAKVKIVSGGFAPIAGIFFRVQGTDLSSGYYMFRIDARAGQGPGLIKSPNTLVQMVVEPAVIGTIYTLKVIVNGNHIQGYVDGVKKIDWTDTANTYPQGGVGVGTFNAHTHFDNVIVTEAPPVKTFSYGTGSDNLRISYDTVFSDDFQDGDAVGWQELSGVWNIVDDAGNYVYEGTATADEQVTYALSVGTFDNFLFEGKVKAINNAGHYGIILREDGTGNHYGFYLNAYPASVGKYYFGYWDGTYHAIVSWTDSGGAYTDANAWNTLKVVANGYQFDLYLNGILVNTVTDTSEWAASGHVGLIIDKYAVGQNTYFDDVSVQVPHYIANLHTKEIGLDSGLYLITIWSGAGNQLGTYLFDLTDAIQGKGRGKGKA